MKKKTIGLFLSCLLALVFIAGPQAQARIFIDVDSPMGNKLPLAVTDLKPLDPALAGNPLLKQFRTILERDLKMCGLFRLLSPEAFLESSTSGITAESVNFSLWKSIGADAVIKGGLQKSGLNYSMEARLFDVQLQNDIVGKRYHFTEEEFEQAVHKFADQIILKLTGESGVFASTMILAARKSLKNKEIVMMETNGKHMTYITQHRSLSLSPDISRNGRYVAYTTYLSGNPDLHLFDRKKNLDRKISNRPGLNLGASFNPTSNLIAVSISNGDDPELFIIDYDGQIKRQLTDNFWIDLEPSWSPDGKMIAYVSTNSGKPHIYRCNADGTDVRRLTYKGFHNVSPSWSPRGDKIAFAGKENDIFDIFIMNPDGTEIQRLTSGTRNNESPAWAPNGQMLAFSSDRTRSDQLYIMAADGSGQTRITNSDDAAYSTPAWSSWLKD